MTAESTSRKSARHSRVGYWVLLLSFFTVVGLVVFLEFFPVPAAKMGLPQLRPRSFTATELGISEWRSPTDFNKNGVPDNFDFVAAARQDARRHPSYDPAYVSSAPGYPAADKGVCADVIWRAFAGAGYSLHQMVDREIATNPQAFPQAGNHPDPNIDFRRVRNLRVFFEKYAQPLTLDPAAVTQWQPGDIVIFGPNDYHIGICAEVRTIAGRPFVIHNGGQSNREEDALASLPITGHFRFDAARLSPDQARQVLIPFEGAPGWPAG